MATVPNGKQSSRRRYRSSIPKDAREKVVERYRGGAKRKAEYRVRGKLVGVRFFEEDGFCDMEYGIKDGKMHGRLYEFRPHGKLMFVEPYRNGVAHGTAYQWNEKEKVIGSYTMNNGTGIDLWFYDWDDEVFLHEVHYMKDGSPHGWEWWLNDDQRTVWSETHWREGKLHGIQRDWTKGHLSRGFPKYWIQDKQVSRRTYLRACTLDKSLPPFRKKDNRPLRNFPPEIRKRLILPAKKRRQTK